MYEETYKEIDDRKTNYAKELQNLTKKLAQLSSEFQSLFDLYNKKVISIEQFQLQNERIQSEQSRLASRKNLLEAEIAIKKDKDGYLQEFKAQIAKILHLDVDDEKVFKLILEKLVSKIEIKDNGLVKIHFNFKKPLSFGA